jgi:phosphopantothenate synthetase
MTLSKITIADAVSEAFGDLSMLGDEMREAFDNTPENLQGSAVGQAREEAADNLEQLSEPSVPDSLAAIEVEIPRWERKRSPSRPVRRDDIVAILDAVIQALDEIVDDEEKSQELKDDAETLRDEIDNEKSMAEDVQFPGMFG